MPLNLKSSFGATISSCFLNDLYSNNSGFYYFVGKTTEWDDEKNPDEIIDSIENEQKIRDDMVFIKKLNHSNLSHVVARINWKTGTIYDAYDDRYSSSVIGVNVSNGGSDYLTTDTEVSFSGGGGSGAEAKANISDGKITTIDITKNGVGYTSAPTVTITGTGENAEATAVMAFTQDDGTALKDAKFYVLTDEFNVFKCLDNNNGAKSTVKPNKISENSFETTDGYVWKFLYKIPPTLRNRFLTTDYMPVYTGESLKYYSDGAIEKVMVSKIGDGYEDKCNIEVKGDGHGSFEIYGITGATITDGGSYDSDSDITIEVDPPYSDYDEFTSGMSVSVGDIIQHDSYFYYEAMETGTLTTIDDTFKKTYGAITKLNTQPALKYVGETLVVEPTVTSGEITSLTVKHGSVGEVKMVKRGSGYDENPPVVYFDGDGDDATGTCIMDGDSVAYIYVDNIGHKNTSSTTVTIGKDWESGMGFSIGRHYVNHNGNLYHTQITSVIHNAGSTPPTHTTGTVTHGGVAYEYKGKPAEAELTMFYGRGYKFEPKISITSDTDSDTQAEITINMKKTRARVHTLLNSDGEVKGTIIEDGGEGYSNVTFDVSGDGSGADFSANVSQVNSDFQQDEIESLIEKGTIELCEVVSGGYGYSDSPTVTISGDGENATATATVTDGVITKINMTEVGKDYKRATITITDDDGAGATARAIISPYLGHGKDNINELFAKDLMFYINIGKEELGDFEIGEEYRQVGVIHKPFKYDTEKYFALGKGSSLLTVYSTINTANFEKGEILTSGDDEFRLIDFTSSKALLQATGSYELETSDILTNDDNNTFIANTIIKPDFDKYSGNIIFYDNVEKIQPQDYQFVSIKTVFRL